MGLSATYVRLLAIDPRSPTTLYADRRQDMFDLAFDREGRREKQGYVTPAQARAFRQMAQQPQLWQDYLHPGSNTTVT